MWKCEYTVNHRNSIIFKQSLTLLHVFFCSRVPSYEATLAEHGYLEVFQSPLNTNIPIDENDSVDYCSINEKIDETEDIMQE